MFIFRLTKLRLLVMTLALVSLIFVLVFMPNKIIGVNQNSTPKPLEQVITEEKVMALTINVDWGEEYLPAILDTLEQYQAKATFFVTGRFAEKNPEILKTLVSRGHLIGNHGYYHSHPDKLSVTKNKEELTKTEKVIEEITGMKTTLYAPPYGERGKNGLVAASEMGYLTVLWTLDTIDWRADSTPQLITQRVVDPKMRHGKIPDKKGAIILMHPKENTVKALPIILSRLQQEGFRMVTVEKLITLETMGNTTP